MKFKVLLDYAIDNHYSNTVDNAYISVMKLLEPLYDIDINEIFYCSIESLKKSLIKRGLSNATINNALSMISVCYDEGMKSDDKMFRNKITNKPLIKKLNVNATKKETKPLERATRELYKKYALENNLIHFYHFIVIAYGTMLRVNEILRINQDCIDFSNNEITIFKTKNKKTHTVYMNEDVRKSILAIHPHYFQNYNYRQILYWFEKAEKVLKCAHFTPHSTRHAGASTLRRSGIDKSIVKEAGNWSSEQIVENYTHVVSPDLKNAFELLQD